MRRAICLSVLLLVTIGAGQYLEKLVDLPDSAGALSGPSSILVNPVTGKCWVPSGEYALVFDPVTLTCERRIEAPGIGIVCEDVGKAYFVSGYWLRLTAVDLSTRDTLWTTRIGENEYPGLTWSRTSNKVYIAASDEEDWDTWVYVLDVTLDSITDSIPMPGLLTAPVWDSITNRVLVGTRTTDTAYIAAIDCATGTYSLHEIADTYLAYGVCLATAERKLYCRGYSRSDGYMVTVMDADLLVSAGVLDEPERPSEMLYNPVLGRLYCTVRDSVYVLDCATDSLRAGVSFDAYVNDLAFSPPTGKVYAALRDPAGVAVIDTLDVARTVVRVPDSTHMLGRTIGCSPNRNEVYCAMERDTIFVIDGSADTLSGALEFRYHYFRRLVYNPAGNKLYAFNDSKNEIAVFSSDLRLLRIITSPDLWFGRDVCPILNPALNRLYVVGWYGLAVVDCNSDEVINSASIPQVNEARCVLHPTLQKLYVFAANQVGSRTPVYVYDCLRGEMLDAIPLRDEVPCAVYHPRSDRIYFAHQRPPTVFILDPLTDSIVDSLELGEDVTNGKMLANTEQDVVYFANDEDRLLYTIDVMTDSVVDIDTLPFAPDTLFWNRRYGKLYLARESSRRYFAVFDCRAGSLLGTMPLEFEKAGVMDERFDKLYLGGCGSGITAVLDCATDSVIAELHFPRSFPWSMAWNPIDNRVYAVRSAQFAVYREDPPAIEELSRVGEKRASATLIRGTLSLTGKESAMLLDVVGRHVLDLLPGENDVSRLSPGVYFVRPEAEPSSVRKVVIQR